MPHAQNLQKIFPVAEGDHAQGPSCSVEREYCPHCHEGPASTCHLPTIDNPLSKEPIIKMNNHTTTTHFYQHPWPWRTGTTLMIVPLSYSSTTNERTNT